MDVITYACHIIRNMPQPISAIYGVFIYVCFVYNL